MVEAVVYNANWVIATQVLLSAVMADRLSFLLLSEYKHTGIAMNPVATSTAGLHLQTRTYHPWTQSGTRAITSESYGPSRLSKGRRKHGHRLQSMMETNGNLDSISQSSRSRPHQSQEPPGQADNEYSSRCSIRCIVTMLTLSVHRSPHHGSQNSREP